MSWKPPKREQLDAAAAIVDETREFMRNGRAPEVSNWQLVLAIHYIASNRTGWRTLPPSLRFGRKDVQMPHWHSGWRRAQRLRRLHVYGQVLQALGLPEESDG